MAAQFSNEEYLPVTQEVVGAKPTAVAIESVQLKCTDLSQMVSDKSNPQCPKIEKLSLFFDRGEWKRLGNISMQQRFCSGNVNQTRYTTTQCAQNSGYNIDWGAEEARNIN